MMLLSILFLIALEITLYYLIKYLKCDFQWLITNHDEKISFDKDDINKFYLNSYHKELGWDRRSNTSKQELIKGHGEYKINPSKSQYSMNNNNSRSNTLHEKYQKKIITFGDSYTFCRHVNDDQTWQWHLSKLLKANVVNHGVGNYGIDQSVQKFHLEIDKYQTEAEIIILGGVPESIMRINSMWKHYSEYGNIFGFKGRYILKDDKLVWIDNIISDISILSSIDKYYDEIKKYDLCYEHKFKKDKIEFPYMYHLLRTSKRNIPLLFHLVMRKLAMKYARKNEKLINRAYDHIMRFNHLFTISLYKDPKHLHLFKRIITNFTENVEKLNMKPIYLFIPYLHDLIYFRKNNIYYNTFISDLKKHMTVIDMTNEFMNYQIEDLYVSKSYGSHVSSLGNQIIAKYIKKSI